MQGVARRAARKYIAGPKLQDALATASRLRTRGFATTLGYWNAADEAPARILEQYRDALSRLAKLPSPERHISIKYPALSYLRPLAEVLLKEALTAGFRVHLDSLWPESVDPTWTLLQEAGARGPEIGFTLPGRWRRSPADAERCTELGLSIRVVKGQWADPADPDRDARAGYLEVIDRLAGRASHVGVATHDAWLAEQSLQKLQHSRTRCELELLYGLPSRKLFALAGRTGVSIRVYVPYGEAFLPYCLGQTLRRPRLIAQLLRDLFSLDIRSRE